MPTFSKLVAAIGFALIGWFASSLAVMGIPDNYPTGWVLPGTAVLGVLIGWRICGAAVGRGYANSAGVGLSSGLLLTVAAVALWAFAQMIRRSLRLTFDGLSEALHAGGELFLAFGVFVLRLDVIAVIAVGSVVTGLLAEALAERKLS